jgi:Na+/H+ antiporter NhaC
MSLARSPSFVPGSAFLLLLLPLMSPVSVGAEPLSSFSITAPAFVLSGVDFTVEIEALSGDGTIDSTYNAVAPVEGVFRSEGGNELPARAAFVNGRASIRDVFVKESGQVTLRIADGQVVAVAKVRSVPGILSILPPLVAILLALVFRHVLVALFAGIWVGAVIIFNYDPLTAFLRVIDHFVVRALTDPDHISIVVFTLLFGGMVGVISKNGGTYGIAESLVGMARTPKRAQLASWLLGIAIFFDDYANTLIVGNTMRPISDKLRISREKLAYIVDSTSAPISSLFFISTWIGYEVGLIDSAIKAINYHVESAYWIFIDTIPYRFYPILTLILGFIIAISGRDFGPMFRAEHRARRTNKVFRDGAELATDLAESSSVAPAEGIPHRWWNGLIPITTVVVVGIAGLYYTGYQTIVQSGSNDFSIGNIVGSANSYTSLLWASLTSCCVAILLSAVQRLLTITQAVDAWLAGVKSMLFAVIILTLAWSIGAVTNELKTADYLVQLLKGVLAPHWLPVLTFLVAAVVSFSTGTSWGTMGVLMPIVIPLAYALSSTAGLALADLHIIMLGTVSSVLAGAVFGDHCSPISDTTILSSMASGCDHIDHVRTQLPYAVCVAITGMIVGDVPTAFGLSPYLSIGLGLCVISAIVFWMGRPVDAAS